METSIRENSRFEILTPFGWEEFKSIKRTTRNESFSVTLSSSSSIECTSEHLLLSKDGFKEVKDITLEDVILTSNGEFQVTKLTKNVGNSYFYDPIDVGSHHQYFANEIINHNCAWLGSSGTLIAGDALRSLQQKTYLPQVTLEEGSLKVFEHPIKQKKEYVNGLERIISPDHMYALVADTSRGKGLDYSAFSIFDITSIPYRQVCTYRNNEISPTDYAEIIHRICRIYNNAQALIEINDLGDQIGNALLEDYAYENLICSESAGRAGKRATYYKLKADKGVRTSAPIKNSGCLILKLLIEQGKLLIADHETVSELTTFSKNKETYKAEKGKHDDMAMTLVLFAWLSDQTLFQEITAINTFNSFSEKSPEELDDQFDPLFGSLILNTSDIMPGLVMTRENILRNTTDYFEPLYSQPQILPNF